MKTFSISFSAIALLLFLTHFVLAEDQKKEISVDEALKYYCQTWINPDYYDYQRSKNTGIKKFYKNGTFEWYRNETVGYPSWSGTFKIENSWIDKDGNVWINSNLNAMGYDHHWLVKITEDGNKL